LTRQDWQDMTTWILQHPGKRCIRKAKEAAILSYEKSS